MHFLIKDRKCQQSEARSCDDTVPTIEEFPLYGTAEFCTAANTVPEDLTQPSQQQQQPPHPVAQHVAPLGDAASSSFDYKAADPAFQDVNDPDCVLAYDLKDFCINYFLQTPVVPWR